MLSEVGFVIGLFVTALSILAIREIGSVEKAQWSLQPSKAAISRPVMGDAGSPSNNLDERGLVIRGIRISKGIAYANLLLGILLSVMGALGIFHQL